MIKSDKETFLKYYQELSRHRISSGYPAAAISDPSDLDSWFNRVEENHQEIREKLGGVARQIAVDIEPPNDEYLVEFSKVATYTEKIAKLCPKYLIDYRLNGNSFRRPFIPMTSDTRRGVSTRQVTFGKHIEHWCELNKIQDSIQCEIKKICKELGKIWSDAKINKCKLYVTITTDPMAFIRLGRYGVDEGSCYSMGAMNESHKFVLANTKDTFIGIVHTDEKNINELNESSIYTRFWGASEKPHNVWHTSNIYPKTPKNGGNILLAIKEGFSQLIATETICTQGIFTPSLIYYNKDSRSYHDNNYDTKTITKFPMDDSGIRWCRKCQICHIYPSSKNNATVQVDTEFYCNACSLKAKRCSVTGVLTMRGCFVLSEDLKREEVVCIEIRESLYVQDIYFGSYVRKSDCYQLTETQWVHKTNAHTRGLNKCKQDGCVFWTTAEDKEYCSCNSCPKKQLEKPTKDITNSISFSSIAQRGLSPNFNDILY